MSIFVLLIVVWLWLVMLVTLPGNYFWRIQHPPPKGSPIRLNNIIDGMRLENITQVILYLVNRVDVKSKLNFLCQLVWEMFYNTLDEDTEAGRGWWTTDESKEGDLGRPWACDSSKILWKCLVDENKRRRVRHPYQMQTCNNRISNWKLFTRRYFR